jgi:hypothetical protein
MVSFEQGIVEMHLQTIRTRMRWRLRAVETQDFGFAVKNGELTGLRKNELITRGIKAYAGFKPN